MGGIACVVTPRCSDTVLSIVRSWGLRVSCSRLSTCRKPYLWRMPRRGQKPLFTYLHKSSHMLLSPERFRHITTGLMHVGQSLSTTLIPMDSPQFGFDFVAPYVLEGEVARGKGGMYVVGLGLFRSPCGYTGQRRSNASGSPFQSRSSRS